MSPFVRAGYVFMLPILVASVVFHGMKGDAQTAASSAAIITFMLSVQVLR